MSTTKDGIEAAVAAHWGTAAKAKGSNANSPGPAKAAPDMGLFLNSEQGTNYKHNGAKGDNPRG